MTKLIAIFTGVIITTITTGFFISSTPVSTKEAKAVVDRIEGNYAVVEFSNDKTTKTQDIEVYDINGTVTEGTELIVTAVKGKFHSDLIGENNGEKRRYYQFKSNDEIEVWWLLSAEEIGHTPNTEDEYILYFSENGTYKDSKVCTCLPEYDCECFLYDDIFLHIEKCELGVFMYTYKKVKGYIEVYKDGVFQFTADDMAEALRETSGDGNKGVESYEQK